VSRLLDVLSEFLSRRKGLLPGIGALLVLVDLLLQFAWPNGWLASTSLLLHLGVLIAVLGLMLAWAL
jgi:hypothetical protein